MTNIVNAEKLKHNPTTFYEKMYDDSIKDLSKKLTAIRREEDHTECDHHGPGGHDHQTPMEKEKHFREKLNEFYHGHQ